MKARWSPPRRRAVDPALEPFRHRIGERVVFVPPTPAGERGGMEYGVITDVDHRMVYVDYGYPNPIWAELGNSIATHPANLRFESVVPQSGSCDHCGTHGASHGPILSAAR
ncbi:hypothetical protein [Nocardia sp. NPDC052566]|uniref:hypothetical protein n=1 Tax=Nocardia sp. NPDC052566 TaxID=3364330 RepID=UPI0037C514A3